MRLLLNVQAELPVGKKRNRNVFNTRAACYYLKQGDSVQLLNGQMEQVEVNDRRMLRIRIRGDWYSHLKVAAIPSKGDRFDHKTFTETIFNVYLTQIRMLQRDGAA